MGHHQSSCWIRVVGIFLAGALLWLTPLRGVAAQEASPESQQIEPQQFVGEATSEQQPQNTPISGLREGASPKFQMSPADGLKLAEKLIHDGKQETAEKILIALEEAPDDSLDKTQLLFLRGLIAFGNEDYKGAVEYYRSIIDVRPDLVRVRLELARSLYALRRDRAAAYQFRLALAGDLPPDTVQKIRGFLWLIQKRKIWRINARASVVPDTNVAAAPRDPFIELNGLQFELNDNALARSGIGFTASLFGEVFPRLTKKWRLEARAGGTFTNYEGQNFDDLIVLAEAGPRYETENFAVSVLATAKRRVFGGQGFNRTIGAEINVEKGFSRRTRMLLTFGGANVTYDRDVLRNGELYFFAGTLNRTLTARSAIRTNITVTREQTTESTLQNTAFQWRAGYRRELPWGITAEAGPELFFRRFDEFDSVDGVRREDWTYGASVFITKRDWRFWGFAPVFSYQFLRNDSNADRFDFNRHRANVGVTRTF